MEIANFFQKNRMIAKVEKVQKSKQKTLDLDDFDLTEFPDIILNCDTLRSLILQRNKISELPKDFGIHLRGLKYLSIQFNNFQSFPECLKHLEALVSINISHNPIKCLTEDIDCFKELRYLWCNSCGLDHLPKSLGNLVKLETFGARHNDIFELPTTICDLKELSWLSLEGNRLDSLPTNFYKLQGLRHLNLNKNCFTSVPTIVAPLNLSYLHLQRNYIKQLDKEELSPLSNIKITLINNPLENGHEFTDFKNLMLNPSDYKIDNANTENISDSSEWESEWENSTDTVYLNYESTEISSESDEVEIVVNVPKLSRFFVSQ